MKEINLLLYDVSILLCKTIYLNVLKNDVVDIYVIGDFEEDEVVNLFDKYMEFNTFKREKESFIIDHDKFKKKENVIKEVENNISYNYCIL